MKGAIMAVGLWVMGIGISWGLIYYHSAESLRQSTVFALRQSLSETMVELGERVNPTVETALDRFMANFSVRKDNDAAYTVDILGYHPDPLLLSVRLSYTATRGAFTLALQATETMIEADHA
jgi:hypothetical protein